ncbi:malonyl-CoA/methylmalonyl-CoA synthetase protein [Dioscorea alata]|uniref:Malonyl-CoA/methylmalonyl-CoA synthetase protein n=2 Tax=Dioscorea alata TaxID=55571 RepID=A0ACB7TSP7_DIOAL|nr:malonyl-CoA/methylmalonyl-CoA synthetase protein [Dioscorea alata]KAH7651755.1 malonyl-CoA/methylmalonyl-CoA synthetase protein [Dioscorea alata]
MISFNSNATLHGLQLHRIHLTPVRAANPFARSGFLGFPVLQSLFHSVQSGGSLSSTFMDVAKVAVTRAATHDSVAIRAEDKSYSFAHLVSSAWSISNLLHAKFSKTTEDGGKSENALGQVIDVNRFLNGARVGIVAKPSAEFVAGLLGTWLSGGVAVPLALSYPEAELLHVMNDSDVTMILSTPEHQELMKNVAAKCSAHFSLIPAVTSNSSEAGSHEHSENGVTDVISKLMGKFVDSKSSEGDDPALILYTSGTTGKPKGVVHTHRGIISQVQILTEAWEYTPSDQFLHCLPLHHVHGLFNALLAPLYAGSGVEFLPKFSVRGVWQRWRESYPREGSKSKDAITLFTGVPTMYTRLLQGYDAMDPDMKASSAFAANKLRLMMCGSSALPYPVMKQWEEITGHRLLERYGMTEFVMALANPLHGNRKGGTVGKPLPRLEVKIITEEESEKDGPAIGELCVRSPSLFKEYWKQPKVTAESFIDGGFFKTGDTVTVDDDGYYIILGRTNADIMKVGGYKLSALDIEAVLLEHEDILEVCVLGLPDKDYGEIVCAIVVPQEHAKKRAEKELKPVMTLEEFQSWAKKRLAPYKIPTKLILWDSLPRNAMGKVNKKEVKKLLVD